MAKSPEDVELTFSCSYQKSGADIFVMVIAFLCAGSVGVVPP